MGIGPQGLVGIAPGGNPVNMQEHAHRAAGAALEPARLGRRAGTAAAGLMSLLLAACAEPAPTITAPPAASGPPIGIDMATDSSDVLNQLKGSHLGFVARYYRDPASRWPALSPSEAQRLSSLGLNIVAVLETHSQRPEFFSYSSGYNNALAAYSQARTVGQPPGSAIYFAVDFDARHEALAAVVDYFRGVNAGLAAAGRGRPAYRIGVYGSGAVCGAVKQARLAQYSWLTNSSAWSGTRSYGDWNIRQTARWPDLSFDHDGDEARDDYGGFRLADYQVASPYAAAPAQPQPQQEAAGPAPTPQPAPAEIQEAAAQQPVAQQTTAQQPEPQPAQPQEGAPQEAQWLSAIRQAFAL